MKMKLSMFVIFVMSFSLMTAACNQQQMVQDVQSGKSDVVIEKKDTVVAQKDAEVPKSKSENQAMKKDAPGVYQDYSAATLTEARAAGKKVVLFFHAPWCPFCRAADASFKGNLDKIPVNVVLLKTDYDSQTALKTKYGVTYQHTFVQLDAQGNAVTKWNGGGIENLQKNIK